MTKSFEGYIPPSVAKANREAEGARVQQARELAIVEQRALATSLSFKSYERLRNADFPNATIVEVVRKLSKFGGFMTSKEVAYETYDGTKYVVDYLTTGYVIERSWQEQHWNVMRGEDDPHSYWIQKDAVLTHEGQVAKQGTAVHGFTVNDRNCITVLKESMIDLADLDQTRVAPIIASLATQHL